jgi:prepilin-type N-terminal cleavage/methylation domain-containing protein
MRRGYTLVELLIVVGVMSILFGTVLFHLTQTSRRVTLSGMGESLIADIKLQQTNAMSKDALGGVSPQGYGIHFEGDRYIMFRGSTYSASDPTNITTTLDPHVRIETITFPNNNLIFAPLSGEVIGFASASSSITLREADGSETNTISLNSYGVITSAH